jgi:hypothetical protein
MEGLGEEVVKDVGAGVLNAELDRRCSSVVEPDVVRADGGLIDDLRRLTVREEVVWLSPVAYAVAFSYPAASSISHAIRTVQRRHVYLSSRDSVKQQ